MKPVIYKDSHGNELKLYYKTSEIVLLEDVGVHEEGKDMVWVEIMHPPKIMAIPRAQVRLGATRYTGKKID